MLPQKSSKVSPSIQEFSRFAMVPASVIEALTATVSPSAFIVYVALASFADRNGVCWPSRKTLASMTNLTVNHISKVTTDLQDAGFLTKEVGNNGLTVYRLTVVPISKHVDPPTQANSIPLRNDVDRTNQGTDQKTRETVNEASAVKASAVKASAILELSEIQQRPKTSKGSLAALPDSWTLPDTFREQARLERPDLENMLDSIAKNFKDWHISKGTLSRCWVAEWNRWIRREYSPGRHVKVDMPVRRYPASNQQQPHPKAVIDLSIQRFQEQCRQMGINPATGYK